MDVGMTGCGGGLGGAELCVSWPLLALLPREGMAAGLASHTGLAGISPTGYRFLRSKVLSSGYCAMWGWVQDLVMAGEEKLAECGMP